MGNKPQLQLLSTVTLYYYLSIILSNNPLLLWLWSYLDRCCIDSIISIIDFFANSEVSMLTSRLTLTHLLCSFPTADVWPSLRGGASPPPILAMMMSTTTIGLFGGLRQTRIPLVADNSQVSHHFLPFFIYFFVWTVGINGSNWKWD